MNPHYILCAWVHTCTSYICIYIYICTLLKNKHVETMRLLAQRNIVYLVRQNVGGWTQATNKFQTMWTSPSSILWARGADDCQVCVCVCVCVWYIIYDRWCMRVRACAVYLCCKQTLQINQCVDGDDCFVDNTHVCKHRSVIIMYARDRTLLDECNDSTIVTILGCTLQASTAHTYRVYSIVKAAWVCLVGQCTLLCLHTTHMTRSYAYKLMHIYHILTRVVHSHTWFCTICYCLFVYHGAE